MVFLWRAKPIVVLALCSVGCVIPPPLERETGRDAQVNSIPVIVEVDPNFPTPGPIAVKRTEQEPMSLTVRDLDVEDTIWVYFYVDYNYPQAEPSLNQCQSSVQSIDRVLTCPLFALCAFEDGPADELHILEAMVTDRELLPVGEPQYRALPADAGVSFRTWVMTCND